MQLFENFISYRRSDTLGEVQNIYHALTNRGFSTFCDIYSLDSGRFDDNIKLNIERCTNYILVLNNHSLDRCNEAEDWLTFEIAAALEYNKNIICVFVGDVDFPKTLPNAIDSIRRYNGIKYDYAYFNGFIDCLISRFLVQENETELSDAERDFLISGSLLVKYVGSAPIVTIPESITVIGENAFKDKTNIKEISFPSKLERIEACAFERCINITHVIFPASLKEICAGAFRRCYNLSFIAFNDGLEIIGNEAFCFCTKLKIIRLGAKISTIAADAFNNCDKLALFSIEDNNRYYSSVEGVLYDSEKKKLIRCPEGYGQDLVIVLPTVEELCPWSFSRCLSLVDVVLPRHLKRIKAHAFSDCSNIVSLTLGDEISEFDESALDGWSNEQRVVVSKRFNPVIKYKIDQKVHESVHLQHSNGGNLPKYVMVKTTFESIEEASKMARLLVNNRFIASAQLDQLNVFYTWNNEACNENEIELSCITKGSLYPTVERFIRTHHSYECCQMICLPIVAASEDFGNWIDEQTRN